ncbi:hypothetical protein Y032_0028g1833 [Ancylostoma ceylanicum]|uniref:Uncharacterized protein n=1 Tax=Ancylostoma ceylanicum TaxID=53326 RepID=A0A016UU81_9BILA|nr:hypothetical protein Y032_0028g1833 [Ancylostoma ceylanicum]
MATHLARYIIPNPLFNGSTKPFDTDESSQTGANTPGYRLHTWNQPSNTELTIVLAYNSFLWKRIQESRGSVFFPSNPPTDKQHPIPRGCVLASDKDHTFPLPMVPCFSST